MRHLLRSVGCAAIGAALGGCTITDSTVAPAVDVIVVEGAVQIRDDIDGQRISVFLHRTVSGGASLAVPGAEVVVTLPDGTEVVVQEESTVAPCVSATPPIVQTGGTCYFVSTTEGLGIMPGDRLELRIRTPSGETLESATTVPGDLRILNADGRTCWYPPDQPLGVVWTGSQGAWAYFSEVILDGLRFALEPEGIPVEIDPLYLTGLSVSAADTTIVLPSEFGLFDRGQLDQELSIRLQQGVPETVVANVSVVALDRNFVNWIRGGNFNPSGQVRVPSVRGDGTGFFGSAVVRRFRLVSVDLGSQPGRCLDIG